MELPSLERRYEEVKESYKRPFSYPKDVKEYYSRIYDFIEAIENSTPLKKLLDDFEKNNKVKEIEDDLINLGEEILTEGREVFSSLQKSLSERKISLPTIQDILKDKGNGVVFAMTPGESLGWHADQLTEQLDKDRDTSIEEVPRITASLFGMFWDCKGLGIENLPEQQELIEKDKRYKVLQEKLKRKLEHLRLPAYKELRGLKVALEGENSLEGIAFRVSHSYPYTKDILGGSLTDINGINREKEKYYLCVQRTYNLLMDLQEQEKKYNLLKKIGSLDKWWNLRIVRDSIMFIVGYTIAHLSALWGWLEKLLSYLLGTPNI